MRFFIEVLFPIAALNGVAVLPASKDIYLGVCIGRTGRVLDA